jgi:hypothetical protein
MPPPDPFKQTYVKANVRQELPDKPNNILHDVWKQRDPTDVQMSPKKHNYRWSTTFNQFKQENKILVSDSRAGTAQDDVSEYESFQ